MTSLKKLLVPYAGLPPATRQALMAYQNIRVHNCHHNADHVVEHALALLLAASQHVIKADAQMKKGSWQFKFEDNPNVLLAGKTVLVLGWGAIGQKLGAVLKALGMKVIAFRRHVEKGAVGADVVAHLNDLQTYLPEAAAIVLAMPLTPETTNVFAKKEFELMSDNCVLVNIARGDIVNEEALYQALKSKSIKAAAFDVWWRYPRETERDHFAVSSWPFEELDNFIMSPHRAGGYKCDDVEKARVEAVAEAINRYFEEGVMPSPVDLSLGY